MEKRKVPGYQRHGLEGKEDGAFVVATRLWTEATRADSTVTVVKPRQATQSRLNGESGAKV